MMTDTVPYESKRANLPRRSFAWRFFGLDTAAEILSFRPGKTSALLFFLTTPIILGIAYDRKLARDIQKDYLDRVQHLSQDTPLEATAVVRRLQIYSTCIPDDSSSSEADSRGLIWFKKYVKPVLVSAGVDYEYTNGQIPGSLGRILIARFKARRFESHTHTHTHNDDDNDDEPIAGQPRYLEKMAERNQVQGGTVLIGRQALKEYLWALKKGYLDELDLDRELRIANANGDVEQEEERVLSRQLEENDESYSLSDSDSEQSLDQHSSSSSNTNKYSGLTQIFKPFQQSSIIPTDDDTPTSSSGHILPAELSLPPLAPILVIPFAHPLGSMKWWPLKIWNYLFGEHVKTRQGAEFAMSLIQARSRDIIPPSSSSSSSSSMPSSMSDMSIWNEDVEVNREWIDKGTRKMLGQISSDTWRSKRTSSPDLDVGIDKESYYDKVKSLLLPSFLPHQIKLKSMSPDNKEMATKNSTSKRIIL